MYAHELTSYENLKKRLGLAINDLCHWKLILERLNETVLENKVINNDFLMLC